MKQLLALAVIALLHGVLSAGPALALSAEAPVTWLGSASELPRPVSKALDDCRFLAEPMESNWLPDNETGGLRAALADGVELYVVTCDYGASNMFDAAVLYASGKAKRLDFPVKNEGEKLERRDTAGNSRWLGDGKLSTYVSGGCAGAVGTEALYEITSGGANLIFQKSNDNCDKPDWKLDYGEEP
jgi:hypothetical protein